MTLALPPLSELLIPRPQGVERAGCRLLRRLHAWSCGLGAQSLDLGGWPGGVEVRSQGSGGGRRGERGRPFFLAWSFRAFSAPRRQGPEETHPGRPGADPRSWSRGGRRRVPGGACRRPGRAAAAAAPAWVDHVEKNGCRSWGPRPPKGVDPAGCPWLRPTRHCLGSGWEMSPADPDAASLCPRGPRSRGHLPPEPQRCRRAPQGAGGGQREAFV